MARYTYRYKEFDTVKETHSFFKEDLLKLAFDHLGGDKYLPLAIKEDEIVIMEADDIIWAWQDILFKDINI